GPFDPGEHNRLVAASLYRTGEVGDLAGGYVVAPGFDHAGRAVFDEAGVEAAGVVEEGRLVGGGDRNHETVDIGHWSLLADGRRPDAVAAGMPRRTGSATWATKRGRRFSTRRLRLAPVGMRATPCPERFIGRSTDSGGDPYTGMPPLETPAVSQIGSAACGRSMRKRLPILFLASLLL